MDIYIYIYTSNKTSELPSQIRISCVPLSKERSFSSSNERRSLLPAIEPTDTVDCTPSNKNQSASFLFIFFLEFLLLEFFFFFFFFVSFINVTAHDFYTVDQEIEEISRISTLRICMRIPHTNLLVSLLLCFEFYGWEGLSTKLHMEFYGNPF